MGVILKLKSNTKYCDHLSLLIDQQKRIVECEDCRATVDPFEFLLSITKRQHNLREEEHKLKVTKKLLIDEINKLKKDRQKLRKEK